MELQSGKQRLQKKLLKRLETHRAMLGLLGQLNKKQHLAYSKTSDNLHALTKAQLREAISETDRRISSVKSQYGVIVSDSDAINLWGEVENAPRQPMWIMKWRLAHVFSRYDRVWPLWTKVPMHTMIMMDLGRSRTVAQTVEMFILEISIYEEMCALFNLLYKKVADVNSQRDGKLNIKTEKALNHATTSMAFYFVESYLNGLAFDHWIKNQSSLDEKTSSLLLEWDFDKKRQRSLTLREKMLQYPKIVTGSKHPPLSESNCEEFEYILEHAKSIRDAVAHASPKLDFERRSFPKLEMLMDTNFEDTCKTVDSAVCLVRKFEILIKDDEFYSQWLLDRAEDGVFPDAVFG